jgi:hypothetical protein
MRGESFRNQQVSLRALEQVGTAQIWHIACMNSSERNSSQRLWGVERGTHERPVGCATSIILEPEEDL